MRIPLSGLILGLCLLSPAHSGPLFAQSLRGGCAEPPPSPPIQRVSLSFPHVQTAPPAPGPAYFVSSEGRLCAQLRVTDGMAPGIQAVEAKTPEPGKAFLLSAMLPGAGQWRLGRERWTAYAALEVWAWSQFLQRRQEGRDLQRRYRDLAWLVARRVSVGTRTDASWEYYEALSRFHSSGAFDLDPQNTGVQPEQNPETFNGSIWVLARALFLPGDPDAPVDEDSEAYQKALRYYMSRAYRPDLAWNWGGNLLHREEYADLIRASDENLRRSTTMIGVILANHLLSAVDALVSGRLGLLEEGQRHLEILLLPAPLGTQEVAVRFLLSTSIIHGR
jgi:hypothetical protein